MEPSCIQAGTPVKKCWFIPLTLETAVCCNMKLLATLSGPQYLCFLFPSRYPEADIWCSLTCGFLGARPRVFQLFCQLYISCSTTSNHNRGFNFHPIGIYGGLWVGHKHLCNKNPPLCPARAKSCLSISIFVSDIGAVPSHITGSRTWHSLKSFHL